MAESGEVEKTWRSTRLELLRMRIYSSSSARSRETLLNVCVVVRTKDGGCNEFYTVQSGPMILNFAILTLTL